MSLPDALEPETDTEEKFTAIYIAVLAVILAISSVGGDNATKDMIRASIQSTDTYSFFQAKNIRQTAYDLAADEFEVELLKPGVTDDMRKLLTEKVAKYRATVKRYESEPEKGDGKKELLAKAQDLDKQRDVAMQQDPYFDFAGAFLQIAIVLASASIIMGGRLLLWISFGLGVLGSLLTINGFTLLVALPFVN